MVHAPQDPKVKEAYDNLIRQTTAQYRALEAHYGCNWAEDRSRLRLQAAIVSFRGWSVQVRRRAAALLELLPASAGAWLVSAHLGLKRLGYRSFVHGLTQRQPVRVHRDDAPGDL
jgi:hypothetical protein